MTRHDLNRRLTMLRRLEKTRELLATLEEAGLETEVAGIQDSVASINAELQQSETAVAAWISGIEDDTTRMIFQLRFIHGMNWETVAKLIGGGNTGKSVSTRSRRYLEAHHVK